MPLVPYLVYNADEVAKEGSRELYLDLIKAHRSAIITGPQEESSVAADSQSESCGKARGCGTVVTGASPQGVFDGATSP